MRRTPRLAAILIPTATLFLCPASSDPATIRVPADQPTIAAGLAVAGAGDEVVVDCGVYQEHGLRVPSHVTLRSVTGAPGCVSFGYFTDIVGADSTIGSRIVGLTFDGWASGGRLWARQAVGAIVEACSFEHIVAHYAVVNLLGSDVLVRDCTFDANQTAYRSRRWADARVIKVSDGSVTIDNCLFRFTNAVSGYGGGSISFQDGGPHTIRSTRFEHEIGSILTVTGTDLQVEDSRFEGGWNNVYTGVYGHFVGMDGGTARFVRCTFAGTSQISQVGFRADGGADLTIEDCTIHDDHYGRLLQATGSTVRVERVIFSQSESWRMLVWSASPFTLSCSDIWQPSGVVFDGTSAPETTGLFLADPQFCDAIAGDFHLNGSSPCLPGASTCGELVGAWPQGCGVVRVEPVTWGRIKALYR